MNVFRLLSVFIVISLLTACSGARTCDQNTFYQEAAMGSKLAVPDDLDEPVEFKELTIPEISPREPDENRTGCLDDPPQVSG